MVSLIFAVYLIIGAAIFYGIEKDAPPPPPDFKTKFIMKTMSEKQMEGIKMGMTKALPQLTQAYKGKLHFFSAHGEICYPHRYIM